MTLKSKKLISFRGSSVNLNQLCIPINWKSFLLLEAIIKPLYGVHRKSRTINLLIMHTFFSINLIVTTFLRTKTNNKKNQTVG